MKVCQKLLFLGLFSIANCFSSLSFAQDTTVVPTGVNSCTDTDSCLNAIMQNTYATLQAVNNLPNYMNTLAEMAVSWLANDDSDTTTQMQSNFAGFGTLLTQDMSGQNIDTVQIAADIFQQPTSAFTTPTDKPSILNTIPNINDLSYSSIFGQPPVAKAASTPYNYIKQVAGLNLIHSIPSASWRGKGPDIRNYYNYFNMVSSIESFNGYVIDNLFTNYPNFNSTQTALINQASSSTWLAEVATEELGKVLRQLLMFESQTYVLLTQMVQLQKQQLAAQTMNNSLLILVNQQNESMLVMKAQGVRPQP